MLEIMLEYARADDRRNKQIHTPGRFHCVADTVALLIEIKSDEPHSGHISNIAVY